MSFKELKLSKALNRALEEIGFQNATPIQEKSFPVIMSGQDVIGIAQTGTGKTFAYLIPVLNQLTYSEQKQPRILIIVPTRELVVQVVDEIKKLTQFMSIRVGGVYGASNINTQKQMVHDGLDILVGTPGRLNDLTLTGILKYNSIKKLIIDEAEEMLNLGFRGQLLKILATLPEKRQNILFSATLNDEVETILDQYFLNPQYIELISRGTPLAQIKQYAFKIPNFYTKINFITHIANQKEEYAKVLIFVKNKNVALSIEKELENSGLQFGVIHSNKSQNQRFKAIQDFEQGSVPLLFATDVVARGVDISNISHVINFDLPKDPGAYIHRIGRTGRADKNGEAISFVTLKDETNLKSIESLMNKKIEILAIPDEVELSEELTKEELPAKRDKNLAKAKKIETPSGAFHEKKAKNKKVQMGGKRYQENKRRALAKSKKSRGR
ncbi:MAG: DEAD/DEAH box helicase [Sphingobacteriaceae bacterium]|nr:DEAD/DEAH box helicase [Sphingobacteriaceae bacterium]